MQTKPLTTIQTAIQQVAQRLEEADIFFGHGTDNPLSEAAWLVAGVLGMDIHGLDGNADQSLGSETWAKVTALVDERINTHTPTAYLLKQAWFAGLEFYVDERVLIPRSHIGEFIQEGFVPWIDPGKLYRVLDLCTGSGCIAIAIAHYFPQTQIDASDISTDALDVARINADRHQVNDRIQLIQSDLFKNIGDKKYDLIVSNPPYVDSETMQTLPAEYRHEPETALAAGSDGLDAVRDILAEATDHLTPDGLLMVETGDSAGRLQRAYPEIPFLWLTTSMGNESVFLLTCRQLCQYFMKED